MAGPKVPRPYTEADEEALIGLWLASTIPGQAFLSEERWRALEPLVREQLLPQAETWVIESDGRLVAFVSLLEHTIGGLFTHPDRQGRGHGRALVEHARRLRSPLYVEVFEANCKALAFYRRCGFTEHRQHVDPASDLVLLTLRMSSPYASRPDRHHSPPA